jgi:hypothetical protein
MKSTSYRAMKFKTINSMAIIYILLAPAKLLVIARRPSGQRWRNKKTCRCISKAACSEKLLSFST